MTGFVGRLRAQLGLDTTSFDQGVKGAATRARTGFAGAFSSVGVDHAGHGWLCRRRSSGLCRGGPRARASAIDEAAKASRRVDGSLAGWEAVKLAASEAGVEVTQLADQLQNLNTRLAMPTEGSTSALARLGLDAAELRDMDVDGRVAAISDAVADLGYDAGQASALLRDLGIEDRRMVNLITAGGAGIRAAAADIEDYGLAVSDVDASAIEAANDQIGRLSMISGALGQQLAVALLPALGELAQTMTDSLRQGGLLRSIVDGLGAGFAALVGAVRDVATVGGGFISWIVDLTEGAFEGMGAIGDLGRKIFDFFSVFAVFRRISWFADLIRGAGGFGNALSLLWDVAKGVWAGIVASAGTIVPGVQAVWLDIQATFYSMVQNISSAWARLLTVLGQNALSLGLEDTAKSIGDAAERAWETFDGFTESAAAASSRADELRASAARMVAEGFTPAREAMAALTDAVARGDQAQGAAAVTADELNTQLAEMEQSGGGAAGGLAQVKDAADGVAASLEKGVDAAASLIGSIVKGDWRSGLSQMLAQIAQAQLKMSLMQVAEQSSGGGFFGWLGKLFAPGNARGTNSWRGGLTAVGEEGIELVDLPATSRVYSANDTAKMLSGGGAPRGGTAEVVVRVDDNGQLQAAIERTSGQVVARARSGIVRDSVAATYSANREVPFR
ncbi:phage tail tape measure protein [Roseicitreum antarcticum]|uniref:hypothetical protein n=1 Tax=Roseicitreum antarcticum TaxID=564137 RepID=UPI0016807560|nr:hypothetical protein [Roseicitreum antarcticum]